MTERPTCHTTHPTTPRSDDPRVERTRAAVIEAASDLLMADGPSAITHANVAAAANVSRTTVYNHWPTQADLLRDTIESLGKVPLRRDQLTGSLRTDLDLLCGHVVQDLADDQRAPMIVNMMERALHDPTVASVRDEFLDAFADVFHTIVQTAIDAGELRTDIDAGRSMAALLGSFLFARFMSADDFGPDFAAAVLDDFVSVNAPR
jgi:TetR/AcrR family transcriptional regulator of autoinduction and epiphytic fitness